MRNNLLFETGDDPPLYFPAKDIGTITMKELINTVRIAGHDTVSIEQRITRIPEVDEVIKRLDSAYEETLGEKTLKDIVLSANQPG